MKRIKPTDRLEFAMKAQDDFREDWNWIDVRMFCKEDFDVYLIGKNDAVELCDLFKRITKTIQLNQSKKVVDNG